MIKVIWVAHRIPGMSDEDFFGHWHRVHGALGTKVPGMRRYIQHHTLAEACDGEPKPTHDGASIAWFDDLEGMRVSFATPEWGALGADAPNLFDRSRRMDIVVATERVVVDGATTPSMVKAIYVANRAPGQSDEEFYGHWLDVHGPLCARVAGLRRYVQNHGLAEARGDASTRMSHDGWSELWFDDLGSMRRSMASQEWQALREDRPLFAQPMSVVVARELPIIP